MLPQQENKSIILFMKQTLQIKNIPNILLVKLFAVHSTGLGNTNRSTRIWLFL